MNEKSPYTTYMNPEGDVLPCGDDCHEPQTAWDSLLNEDDREYNAMPDVMPEQTVTGIDTPEVFDLRKHQVETLVNGGMSYALAEARVYGTNLPEHKIPRQTDDETSRPEWGAALGGGSQSDSAPTGETSVRSKTPLADAIETRRLDGLEGKERTTEVARQRARRQKRNRPYGEPSRSGRITSR